MRIEASLEEWKELYEIAMNIKKLEPWNYLWDMDLITIQLPDRDEPCFCSILGQGGQCYGINAFIGLNGLNDYLSIVQVEDTGMPIEYVMLEQSNLSCFWGNREEVPNKQKKIIKDLGLKFRGKNQWLYFESYKKGYMPYVLDKEETILLTECFKHLYIALREYQENKLSVHFDQGETLLHQYDIKNKQWITQSAPLPFTERKYPILILQDELLKAKMKKQPKVNAALELDMVYMNARVTDKKYDRPVNPKLLLLMDHEDDIVISQEMLTPQHNEAQEIINMFINFIMQHGRMKKVIIRNPHIGSVLYDTCQYCEIDLIMQRELSAVDAFIDEFKKLGY